MRPLICIDVDGTLLEARDGTVSLQPDVVMLVMVLHRLAVADLVLWSGGGAGYAESVARRTGTHALFNGFGLKGKTWEGRRPDITLDDQEFAQGTVNLRLPGRPGHDHSPWMGLGLG
jgi:hypothetical protein